MNLKKSVLVLFVFTILQSVMAQTTRTVLPKIENYTKGELEIMVQTFSSKTPIGVGMIAADGTIHFNFPDLDLNAMYADEEAYFFSMGQLDRAVGMFVCHDKTVNENTETVSAIEVRNFFVYKYGRIVGQISPATQEEVLTNEFAVGSRISWFYSDGDGRLKASCTVYEDDENFDKPLAEKTLRNKTNYDISFKKGWNMVVHSLLEKKDMTIDNYQFSRRLLEEKQSVATIPSNMNWYLNYTANDELLEIENQLLGKKAIANEHYEDWSPKALGNFKRTHHEVGKTLERMPSMSNVNLLFEEGAKQMDLTIVDCAGNKDAVSMFTLMVDMASRDWKDKTETGYESASEMDGKRVLIAYDEKEVKTLLHYHAIGRFLVKVEAINIAPEELWEHVKTLDFEALLKE